MFAVRFPVLVRWPVVLLAVCGLLFAGKFMLTKAALDAGAQPFQLAFIGNLGAGLCLLLIVIGTGQTIPFTPSHVALYVGLGLLSFAVPALLANAVVQRVGPAYASTVYALSPVLTLTFAAGIGMERMTLRRLAGISFGFAGMMVLVRQQIASIDVGQPLWALLGLLLPASAAMGNIVRTAFWPKGISALAFSCATLLASSAILASLATLLEPPSGWRLASHQLGIWLASLVGVSGLSYVLNCELQHVAGPVSFSQIGYWGAAFGVVLGALIFDDVLGPLSILGIAAIVVGGVIAKRPV